MTLTPASRLGPYEIVSRIGAGGMGEVFKARDTRLERVVAIKVLPSHLSSSPSLRERFEREARAISSLNHPHICQLYDVGHSSATSGASSSPADDVQTSSAWASDAQVPAGEPLSYLVMEYLEGENLADRLERGPLPLDQLLRFGAQLADALGQAHRQGVVHRDLKPGNVMLTKSGAKLLDFGLAKSLDNALFSPDAPTQHHKPLTAEGTILGTFQYMAPEQLEGALADERTDIFALGVVLYEMATGMRAFDGKTRTSLIAAIVGGSPRRIKEVQPLTPSALEHVIDKCIEKDPDQRWQSAQDVASELRWIAEGGSTQEAPASVKPTRRTVIAAVVLALLAGLAGGFALTKFLVPKEQPQMLQASIVPPRGITVSQNESDDPITLSPDGKVLAFTGRDPNGKKLLWIRPLDELEARSLPATEDARHPFWAPDSQSLAFFSKGKLKKIALDGSPPVTVCDVASNPLQGSWGSDGTILFSPASGGPVHRVAASGGPSEAVTRIDPASGETTHRWAEILPDGESFLYMAGSHHAPVTGEVNAIYAAKFGSFDRKLVTRARSNFDYSGGHLLFVRNGTLLAQRFDPDELKVEGEAVPVVSNVHEAIGSFFSSFSLSRQGRLAYATREGQKSHQVVWLDGAGKQTGVVADLSGYESWTLSPDRKMLAVTINDPSSGLDIWLYDLPAGTRRRLTMDGSGFGAWSPDGKRIAYVGEKSHYFIRGVEGDGATELLLEVDHWGGPHHWSPDGRFIVMWKFDPKTKNGYDATILSMAGERKVIPLAATTADEQPGPFSPDGTWVLYESNATGRNEIYAASVAGLQTRRQVSFNGGGQPTWVSPREVWYREPDGTWVSATLDEQAKVSSRRTLFRNEAITGLERVEDDRLIAAFESGESAPSELVVVSDWKQLLKRKE